MPPHGRSWEKQRLTLAAAVAQLQLQVGELDALIATEPDVEAQLAALQALPDPTPQEEALIAQLEQTLEDIAQAKLAYPTLSGKLQETQIGLDAIESALEQLNKEQNGRRNRPGKRRLKNSTPDRARSTLRGRRWTRGDAAGRSRGTAGERPRRRLCRRRCQ